MFFKRMLVLQIIKSSNINLPSYKEEIRNILVKNNNNVNDDDISEDDLKRIRTEYLKKVYCNVKDAYKKDKDLYSKIIEIEKEPSVTGYNLDLEVVGFLGGTIFAIIYFAKKGRPAKPIECIELNHRTNDIMRESLKDLDKEFDN